MKSLILPHLKLETMDIECLVNNCCLDLLCIFAGFDLWIE